MIAPSQHRKLVFLFIASNMIQDPSASCYVDEVHTKFLQWCSRLGVDNEVSLDTFGRLIPKMFVRERKMVDNARFRKAFIGWKLKEII